MPIELKSLVAPYRAQGRLVLRIEGLAQHARLSAGRNNGDHTWSLGLDELEDLRYFAPGSPDHILFVRILSLDESGGTTLAVVKYPVGIGGTGERLEARARETGNDFESEIARLQQELSVAQASGAAAALRLASERKTIREERDAGKLDEARRMEQGRQELEASFQEKLEAMHSRHQRDLESARLEAQRLRKGMAKQKAQADQSLAELEARCRSAEAAADVDGRLQQKHLAETSKLLARCEEMQSLLADAEAKIAHSASRQIALEQELEDARRKAGDAALKAGADIEFAVKRALEKARAQWEGEHVAILLELRARCEKAEADLANRPPENSAHDDGYIRTLEGDVRHLRQELVSREVTVAHLEARLAETPARPLSALTLDAKVRRALPEPDEEPSPSRGVKGVLRDAAIVVAVAAAIALLWPRIDSLLPFGWGERVDALSYLLSPAAPVPASSEPVVAAKPPAVLAPLFVLTQPANMRGAPSPHAALLSKLKTGTQAEIVTREGNWAQLRVTGQGPQGWVYKPALAAQP